MLNSIISKARAFATAILVSIISAIVFVADRFPHDPASSTKVARLKAIYLIPTALVLIPLSLLKGLAVTVLDVVLSLIGVVIGAVLSVAHHLFMFGGRLVVGLPQFAWTLMTHKPITPFEALIAALRKYHSTGR